MTEPTIPPADSPQSDPAELPLLDPATVTFRREGHTLQMRRTGEEEWRAVTLTRLFPLSEPEHWIAVIDAEDKEIGLLLDLRGLASESLAAARAELERRYLIPEVLRIIACRDRFELTELELETDRGCVAITLRNPNENIQQPLPHHITLTDVEGNRYDIPDIDQLDIDSRRWLEERM
jgi:hypothetical protein